MRWYGHSGHYNKLWLQLPLAVCALYFVLFHLGPALQHHFTDEHLSLPQRLDPSRLTSPHSLSSNLTTNLVVASIKANDVSWTARLQDLIPNLKIIRYVSDDPTAEYHPPVPKAREALMYFTYLQDFYQDLADINIFIHPDETAWHVDTAHRKSLTFALAHLDLARVVSLGYVNLRTSAGDHPTHDCPNGFDTSLTRLERPSGEEALMAPAFRSNFFGEPLPKVISGPCCSQFAVSKAAILSRPRTQYQRSAKLLVESTWSDQTAGRPWERMWPYLFQRRAIDCNSEWRMLCRLYGICFEGGKKEKERYERLWGEKERLEEEIGFWREVWKPFLVRRRRERLREVEIDLQQSLIGALDRGLDMKVREDAGSELRDFSS